MNLTQINQNLAVIIAKLCELPIQGKYAADMADCLIGLQQTQALLNEPEPEPKQKTPDEPAKD